MIWTIDRGSILPMCTRRTTRWTTAAIPPWKVRATTWSETIFGRWWRVIRWSWRANAWRWDRPKIFLGWRPWWWRDTCTCRHRRHRKWSHWLCSQRFMEAIQTTTVGLGTWDFINHKRRSTDLYGTIFEKRCCNWWQRPATQCSTIPSNWSPKAKQEQIKRVLLDLMAACKERWLSTKCHVCQIYTNWPGSTVKCKWFNCSWDLPIFGWGSERPADPMPLQGSWSIEDPDIAFDVGPCYQLQKHRLDVRVATRWSLYCSSSSRISSLCSKWMTLDVPKCVMWFAKPVTCHLDCNEIGPWSHAWTSSATAEQDSALNHHTLDCRYKNTPQQPHPDLSSLWWVTRIQEAMCMEAMGDQYLVSDV